MDLLTPGCHTVHFLLRGQGSIRGHVSAEEPQKGSPVGYAFLCSSWRKVMGMRLYETQKTALGTSIKFKCRKLVFIWIQALSTHGTILLLFLRLCFSWDTQRTLTIFPQPCSELGSHLE